MMNLRRRKVDLTRNLLNTSVCWTRKYGERVPRCRECFIDYNGYEYCYASYKKNLILRKAIYVPEQCLHPEKHEALRFETVTRYLITKESPDESRE